MPREFFQKLALYSLLPCILAFVAMFLNGLFQPQLQWNVKLLENQGETYRIENLGVNTTTLLNMPDIQAYSKEGYRCGYAVDWVYVQNQALQEKLNLEKWVNANNGFTSWVTFLAILHAVVNAIYLLKQKTGWVEVFVITLLTAIAIVMLITVLGPIKGGPVLFCVAQIKTEAELTKISYDGMIYAFLGAAADILAVVIMIARYFQKTNFDQVNEKISTDH